MELSTARRLVDRAVTEAARFGRPLCVSVCNADGLLAAFARMDGAPARSIELSQCKAYSAARLGVTTTAFHERLVREGMPASYFCDPRLTGMAGGRVLRKDGLVAGGIGISGLAPHEDQQIADLLAGE